MKLFILEGSPSEILETVKGLTEQGLIAPTSVQLEEAGPVQDEQEQAEQEPATPEPVQDQEPKKKRSSAKGDKDYYKEGTIYKQVVDMYNTICTKLARRTEFVNFDLKRKIDKLFSKDNPMKMDDIKSAFEAYQNGKWFDDPDNRSAYGNFMWCIQRTKIENALMGKYKFNFSNKNNYGNENQSVDRKQLGSDSVKSRGFDF